MAIHMGYMGWAKVGGHIWKITGSSLNPTQAINAPQLVQGSYLRKAWNYGPIETAGNITGPAGELTFGPLYGFATQRDSCGDKMASATISVEIQYVCSQAGGNSYRRFANCQINSFTVSVTAGDVANLSIDFFGGAGTSGVTCGAGSAVSAACERLITWDQCKTGTLNGVSGSIESWELTLNNNLVRAYAVGQTNLNPVEILAGIKEFSGSLGVYAPGAPLCPSGGAPYYGADAWANYTATGATISGFKVLNTDILPAGAKVVTARTEAAVNTGPAIYTVRFEGVCEY